MYFDVSADDAHLRNTILSGNRDGSPGAEGPDCFPFATSDGSNIFGTLTGCDIVPQGSDKVGVDPMLLPLADNGGSTLTHALLPGSPAIDGADPAFAPATDQRGVARNAPRTSGPTSWCSARRCRRTTWAPRATTPSPAATRRTASSASAATTRSRPAAGRTRCAPGPARTRSTAAGARTSCSGRPGRTSSPAAGGRTP